jgi:hypothetical protein
MSGLGGFDSGKIDGEWRHPGVSVSDLVWRGGVENTQREKLEDVLSRKIKEPEGSLKVEEFRDFITGTEFSHSCPLCHEHTEKCLVLCDACKVRQGN